MNQRAGEKRLHVRWSCRAPVIFENEFGDEMFFVHSRDVSEGGVFLETDIPVRIGSMILFSLQFPGQAQTMRATGQVVRNTLQGPQHLGVGIRFVGLSTKALGQLQSFLNHSPRA